MLSAFVNSLKIPDLRTRIFYTFWMIFLCRILAAIPAPGVNRGALSEWFNRRADGGIASMFNMFTGGALEQFAVAALGIMPYISASIILQLATAVVPTLQKLQREGEVGKQKITQYTRYLTLLLCLVQSYLLMNAFSNPQALGLNEAIFQNTLGTRFLIVITMTTAAMLLVWMGEQITDKGVGNGVSLIITISIISQLPQAIRTMWSMFTTKVNFPGWDSGPRGLLKYLVDLLLQNGDQPAVWSPFHLIALLLFFFIVTAGTVMLTMGVRKVPVTHAKRVVGRKVYGGQNTHFPLRVNYAGVMPIIFAQALLMFPQPFFQNVLFKKFEWQWAADVGSYFGMETKTYMLVYIAMLMFFSFFWVAAQFNPIQIADQLKKDGGYIPGIRPGKSTADFLDRTMTRLTLAGAICLTFLAILPMILNSKFNIPFVVAQFFGGTSLLIIVGVMLDTMRQIESHLLNRHYDGFLRKGKGTGTQRKRKSKNPKSKKDTEDN